MSTPVIIKDGKGKGTGVKVSSIGQLTTAVFDYDLTKFNTLSVNGQAFNFYSPRAGHNFVITGFIAYADRSVNDANDTVIDIYEADSDSSGTIDKMLISFGLGKTKALPALPLNILVNEGVFINAKTSDNNILLTIMGYFIPCL